MKIHVSLSIIAGAIVVGTVVAISESAMAQSGVVCAAGSSSSACTTFKDGKVQSTTVVRDGKKPVTIRRAAPKSAAKPNPPKRKSLEKPSAPEPWCPDDGSGKPQRK